MTSPPSTPSSQSATPDGASQTAVPVGPQANATPSGVSHDALVERLRAFPQFFRNGGIWIEGTTKEPLCAAAADAITALERELQEAQQLFAAEEAAHEQTIGERDLAEEALSNAYYKVTGRAPEWSSGFGYSDALEEIDTEIYVRNDAVAEAKSALAVARAELQEARRLNERLREALDRVTHGHTMDCTLIAGPYDRQCNCGYNDALSLAEGRDG